MNLERKKMNDRSLTFSFTVYGKKKVNNGFKTARNVCHLKKTPLFKDETTKRK